MHDIRPLQFLVTDFKDVRNAMRHCGQDYLEKSLLQVRNISRAIVFIVPLLRDGGKTRASFFLGG